MLSWKKIKTEVIHKNPFWTYKKDTFEVPGLTKPAEYYYVETRGSVVIVPILSDGRVLFIKIYRCLFDKFSIEFPGGGVDAGQSFEEAARAELQEEAGLETEELINIGEFCPFNGVSTEICRIFLARGLKKTKAEKNPQEIIELAPRRFDEVEDMVKRNEIWDGQTLAAWNLARRYCLTIF
ncbi:MAG: NUDIX hydrolase [Candidatus Magasanikbacteria bacterium]|nr:NUDIX hydrolase [Candidatus Magasanikbacteria bacterium]